MTQKMYDLAMDLALNAEDLSDAIFDIMDSRAEAINAEGTKAQIEFLFADYCDSNPETMRNLLNKLVKEKQAD